MFCNNVPAGKSDKVLSKFNKINFSALPQGFFRHFRLYPQFRGNAEKSPFLVFFSSCAQTKENFGKLFDVFERQLLGFPENAIRNYARNLFTHLFYAQTQKFWRCPNFPYIREGKGHISVCFSAVLAVLLAFGAHCSLIENVLFHVSVKQKAPKGPKGRKKGLNLTSELTDTSQRAVKGFRYRSVPACWDRRHTNPVRHWEVAAVDIIAHSRLASSAEYHAGVCFGLGGATIVSSLFTQCLSVSGFSS